MKYTIKRNLGGSEIITLEILCEENADNSVKLGKAIIDANLKGACLEDAYLEGAYLKGAYLKGACVADIGQRSDGYQFFVQNKSGVLWVIAGCCYFTIADARAHWNETRNGTPLGVETMAMLDHGEAMARHRGWISKEGFGI